MKTLKEEYKQKISDFAKDVEEMITHRFMEDKIIHPIVFGLIIKGDKLVMTVLSGLGELFDSDAGKEQAAQIIKSMSKELKPVALAFISEGWMSSHAVTDMDSLVDENGDYHENAVRPSQDPNRKEVLMVMLETFDEEASVFIEIKRIGELVELEDFQRTDWCKKTSMFKGRFANMLEDNHNEINQVLQKMLNKKESQN